MKIYAASNRHNKLEIFNRLVGQDQWLHVTLGWPHYWVRFLQNLKGDYKEPMYKVYMFQARADETAPFFPPLTPEQEARLFEEKTFSPQFFEPVYPLEMFTTEELFTTAWEGRFV